MKVQRLAERRTPKRGEAVGPVTRYDIVCSAWEHAAAPERGHCVATSAEHKVYGGESGTDKEKEYYKAFKLRYKQITAKQQEWIREVLNTGKLVTETGLVFYWPNTKIMPSGYIVNKEAICNYPVQSLATADIVPISVVYQWHLMKQHNLQSFLINTIHDSSIGEVHPDERDIYKEIAESCFKEVSVWYLEKVYGIEFFVKLSVETEYKRYWSHEKEWSPEQIIEERY